MIALQYTVKPLLTRPPLQWNPLYSEHCLWSRIN